MAASDYATIRYDESQSPVALVTLNRPEKRNPIGPITCGELVHALSRARENTAVRVVVLTGAGKVFSAGGDLGQMSGGVVGTASVMPASLVDLFATMHALQKPIVAMVNGHALAGGMGLMVACDMVCASADAEFGTTEINLGLWPMMITAEIVRSIGRKKALWLMLTGKRISASEAERIGLVTQVFPPEKLEEETMALAKELASKSPSAMRLGLKAFYETQDMDLLPALSHLEGQLAAVLATEDAAEGISAFLQKRPPVWKGR
ncbi:MAG: enoyl-CoA hydratase/isomerase family protein [Deltaproteobacteria bacterium]|nr:enoyl-CoA hydratase/isomerase family protein [Deltaproteobacteria bacterium]